MTDIVIAVVLLGTSALFLLGCGLVAATKGQMPTPTNATPAPVVDSQVRGRAPQADDECMRLDCDDLWEVSIHGWRTCRAHDARTPFDQDEQVSAVIEAAREITRQAAS